MSEIGKLIQAYQDRHGTSDRALALRVGVTATLVGRWKRGLFVELPKPDRIRALAELIGPRPTEEEILDAFLADTGYREDVGDAGVADEGEPDPGATRPGDAERVKPILTGGKSNKTVTKLSDRSSKLQTPEPRVAKKRPPKKGLD